MILASWSRNTVISHTGCQENKRDVNYLNKDELSLSLGDFTERLPIFDCLGDLRPDSLCSEAEHGGDTSW